MNDQKIVAAANPLKKVIAKAEALRDFCDKVIKAARDEKQTLINTWAKSKQISDKAKQLSRALVAAASKKKGPPQLKWAEVASRVADRFIEADEGQEFANLLKKKYRGVKFNAKTGQGSADLGLLNIKFHQSSNDDVVRVEGSFDSFKLPPEDAFQILQGLAKELRKA